MGEQWFDVLTRRMATPATARRAILRFLAGGALTGVAARLGGGPEAAAGCATVGKPCERTGDC